MTKKFILFVTLVALGFKSQAADVIQVGIMFGTDYSLSSQEKVDKAAEYEDFLNIGLTNSGITDRQFEVYAVQSPIIVNPVLRTARSLLDWMEAENQDLSSTLRLVRDNVAGTNGGLDVIVLIATTIKDRGPACGFANGVPRNVNVNKSETHAFGGVLEHPSCIARAAQSIAHEVGHILYAEHEIADDGNGFLTQPDRRNHGYINSSGDKSIMVGTHSVLPDSYRFSGSPGFTGDLTYSDVKSWIQGYVWDTVAAYRTPPPPPKPTGTAELDHCFNYFLAQFTVTFGSGTGSGGPTGSLEVEYKTGSTWNDYYDGGDTCLPYTSDATTVFRARAVNAGGYSAWHGFIAQNTCGNSGNGW